jgi:hypothetical protein
MESRFAELTTPLRIPQFQGAMQAISWDFSFFRRIFDAFFNIEPDFVNFTGFSTQPATTP